MMEEKEEYKGKKHQSLSNKERTLPYSHLGDGLDDELIDYPPNEAAPETYNEYSAKASATLSGNL